MRPLLGVLGPFGLLLGLAAAVTLHSLPAVLVGEGSFFLYAAPGSLPTGTRVDVTLAWTPSLFSLGGLGLVTGVAVAVALGRAGWRLERSHGDSGGAADDDGSDGEHRGR